jgi:hypothetical protein
VVVTDFDYQLGTQRLPREVLALAPTALTAGHAVTGFNAARHSLRPLFPWVSGERILSIRCEELHELSTYFLCEARADADMTQHSGVVVESEQQRTN